MTHRDVLDKSTAENGNTIYNLNPLLEDMSYYEATRVAIADCLDLSCQKVPLQDDELGECVSDFLSNDLPERFQSQFVGMEYMGEFQLTAHSDGTMVVKCLDDSEEV